MEVFLRMLRFGLVVARSEERLEMEQGIQDDKGERTATEGIIEAPTKEKDVEMNPVTIVKEFEGRPINHDEVSWEQNIDSLVMPTNSRTEDKVNQDPNPIEKTGVSLDHTGQGATYFFSTSEIN